jgi:hypothetical protein
LGTTACSEQVKLDWFNGGQCLQTTLAGVTCTCSSTTAMTSLSNTSGISVGEAVTGTNAGASTYVSHIVSNTALTLSVASSGALTSATFTADVFNIALIIVSPAGTYNQTQLNYGIGSGTPGTVNVGTDEVANGSGYTTGGFALTNTSAVLSSTTGVGTFSVNPSWTSASFSTTGGLIYNATGRQGYTGAQSATNAAGVNHTVSYHDFGGTQTVTSGTFTLTIPTANSSTGLLRIS